MIQRHTQAEVLLALVLNGKAVKEVKELRLLALGIESELKYEITTMNRNSTNLPRKAANACSFLKLSSTRRMPPSHTK